MLKAVTSLHTVRLPQMQGSRLGGRSHAAWCSQRAASACLVLAANLGYHHSTSENDHSTVPRLSTQTRRTKADASSQQQVLLLAVLEAFVKVQLIVYSRDLCVAPESGI